MPRADKVSRLISEWQQRQQTLLDIAEYFREHHDTRCVEIATFGLSVLQRCTEELQRTNYPLHEYASAAVLAGVSPAPEPPRE